MKLTAEDLAIDLANLKNIVSLANSYGAKLQVRRHTKYPYIICGRDQIDRQVKMGGTAFWLHNELLKTLTNYF